MFVMVVSSQETEQKRDISVQGLMRPKIKRENAADLESTKLGPMTYDGPAGVPGADYRGEGENSFKRRALLALPPAPAFPDSRV